jgi:hypothetical protein
MEAHSLIRGIGHSVACLALLGDEMDLVEYPLVYFCQQSAKET